MTVSYARMRYTGTKNGFSRVRCIIIIFFFSLSLSHTLTSLTPVVTAATHNLARQYLNLLHTQYVLRLDTLSKNEQKLNEEKEKKRKKK